jgi:hypothetical protein
MTILCGLRQYRSLAYIVWFFFYDRLLKINIPPAGKIDKYGRKCTLLAGFKLASILAPGEIVAAFRR